MSHFMMCYVWWTWSGAARKYWQLVRKKNVVVSVDQMVTVGYKSGCMSGVCV